jgi:hypothetical protein
MGAVLGALILLLPLLGILAIGAAYIWRWPRLVRILAWVFAGLCFATAALIIDAADHVI